MGILHERGLDTSPSGRIVEPTIGDAVERPAATLTTPFVEFWVWHDSVLLPATDEELEWIHARERERTARWRLRRWSQAQNTQRPTALRSVTSALSALMAGRSRDWSRP